MNKIIIKVNKPSLKMPLIIIIVFNIIKSKKTIKIFINILIICITLEKDIIQ